MLEAMMDWACDLVCRDQGMGKPLGKWPLGRLRRRWEDNINLDLREMGDGYN
jgi:hypothetical protein